MTINNLKTIRKKLNFSTKTNIIDLVGDFEEFTGKILLAFENSDVGIDLFKKVIKREINQETGRRESSDVYYKRVHAIIGSEIKSLTNTAQNVRVKYELIPLKKDDAFLVFFISPSINVDEDAINETLAELDDLTLAFDEKQKRRIVQSLLSLITKAAVYEKCQHGSGMSAEFFNSELLLSPIVGGGAGKTYVSALKPSFFFSDHNELIFELSTCSYELEKSKKSQTSSEMVSGALNCFMIHKGTEMAFANKVKATKVKRDFYATAKGFGDSKLLAYSFLNEVIQEKLDEIGLSFSPRNFSPKFEVDAFARLSDDFTKNIKTIYVVDTKNALSTEIDGYDKLLTDFATEINAHKIIDLQEYTQLTSKIQEPSVFIFANGSKNDDNSIEYFNNKLLEQLKVNNKEGSFPTFNTTFQAIERRIRDKKDAVDSYFDPYTTIKMDLLDATMSGAKSIHCYQGLNISKDSVDKYLASLDFMAREAGGEVFSAPEARRLMAGMSSFKAKIEKIQTEIYLKQALFCGTSITLKSDSGELPRDGAYYVDYFKHTTEQDNNEYYHSKIKIIVSDGTFKVADVRVSRHIRDLVNAESPYLKNISKIYNESYFIHSLESGETVTSYNSIRTPLLLENSTRNAASEWIDAIVDPTLLKRFGRSGAEDCPIPFYITLRRGTKDTLSDGAKQHHYMIIEPNGNECLLFITNANFPTGKIHKQILCKNIVCWNKNGEQVLWSESPLLDFYLGCHTYNVVKLNESAKTSLVTKLATIALLN